MSYGAYRYSCARTRRAPGANHRPLVVWLSSLLSKSGFGACGVRSSSSSSSSLLSKSGFVVGGDHPSSSMLSQTGFFAQGVRPASGVMKTGFVVRGGHSGSHGIPGMQSTSESPVPACLRQGLPAPRRLLSRDVSCRAQGGASLGEPASFAAVAAQRPAPPPVPARQTPPLALRQRTTLSMSCWALKAWSSWLRKPSCVF
mmetsp:Transcript_51521/g.137822  ORF Transcript_51521/g.137822 Transcript_51521/m.137822 type:complete len:200 (+) Transcript_51521:37-636(+)